MLRRTLKALDTAGSGRESRLQALSLGAYERGLARQVTRGLNIFAKPSICTRGILPASLWRFLAPGESMEIPVALDSDHPR